VVDDHVQTVDLGLFRVGALFTQHQFVPEDPIAAIEGKDGPGGMVRESGLILKSVGGSRDLDSH
jgi:hypothetical protein